MRIPYAIGAGAGAVLVLVLVLVDRLREDGQDLAQVTDGARLLIIQGNALLSF